MDLDPQGCALSPAAVVGVPCQGDAGGAVGLPKQLMSWEKSVRLAPAFGEEKYWTRRRREG